MGAITPDNSSSDKESQTYHLLRVSSYGGGQRGLLCQ